jgi:predicted nuclease of predicted toxin-antitoxin system
VRFLVDENLSPQLCEYLTSAGDDAEHAHQATGPGATDQQILSYARSHAAVIVTADTDFGALLAQAKTAKPSVILVRELLSLPVANRDNCCQQIWNKSGTPWPPAPSRHCTPWPSSG